MQPVAMSVILAVTVAARAIAGSWTHPAAATCAAWALFVSLPALAGFDEAPLSVLIVAMVCVGSLLAAPLSVRRGEVSPVRIESSKGLRRFVVLGGVSGAASGLLTLRANGIAPDTLLSLTAINLAARDATALRYASALSVPSLAILLLAVTYGAALAAPYAAAQSSGWRRGLLLAAPTTGGALFALATTARAGFLIAAMITAGSWLVTRGVSQGGRGRLPAKSLLGITAGGVALAGMFVYSALTRMGGWRPDLLRNLTDKVALYAGGGLPAYDKWMHQDRVAFPSLGSETLAGVSQFIFGHGIGDAYKDRVDVGRGMSTNVYTILRPLTEDFTAAGAVVVLTLGTVAASYAFRRAATRRSVNAALFASLWLGIMLFGSTTSILSFTNVCFGIALGWFLILRTATFSHADATDEIPSDVTEPAGMPG